MGHKTGTAQDDKWFHNLFVRQGLNRVKTAAGYQADYNVFLEGAQQSTFGDAHSLVEATAAGSYGRRPTAGSHHPVLDRSRAAADDRAAGEMPNWSASFRPSGRRSRTGTAGRSSWTRISTAGGFRGPFRDHSRTCRRGRIRLAGRCRSRSAARPTTFHDSGIVLTYRHPERSEGSRSRREMLRGGQKDPEFTTARITSRCSRISGTGICLHAFGRGAF